MASIPSTIAKVIDAATLNQMESEKSRRGDDSEEMERPNHEDAELIVNMISTSLILNGEITDSFYIILSFITKNCFIPFSSPNCKISQIIQEKLDPVDQEGDEILFALRLILFLYDYYY